MTWQKKTHTSSKSQVKRHKINNVEIVNCFFFRKKSIRATKWAIKNGSRTGREEKIAQM